MQLFHWRRHEMGSRYIHTKPYPHNSIHLPKILSLRSGPPNRKRQNRLSRIDGTVPALSNTDQRRPHLPVRVSGFQIPGTGPSNSVKITPK